MIRYSKLSYVALNVSDIERSKAFYTEILGLQLSEIGAQGEVYLRCSADHHNVVLTQGEPVGIRRHQRCARRGGSALRALNALPRTGVP